MSINTLYTNMDWKATPDYDPKKGTAGAPDPETGIVKCEEGKTARTDEVEIIFCGNLSEDNAAKVKAHIESLKETRLLATKGDPNPTPYKSWSSSYKNSVNGADGSTFEVRYCYDRDTGKDYRSDYLAGMKAMAEHRVEDRLAEEAERAASPVRVRKDTYVVGERHDDYCYSINIKSDIIANFSTASSMENDRIALDRAFSDMLKEIEQNIAQGKENPSDGLKTTVNINGIKWNFAELLNTVDEMNKSFEYFDTHVTMDYSDYAQLGVSKARVMDWTKKNLSEDKQNVIGDAMNARVETYIRRERESLEMHRHIWDKPGVVISGDKAKYYDSSVLSASNKEVREEIMKLFEETDYNEPASVSKTVNKYGRIMLPIFEAFCGRKSAAPEYVSSAVNSIYKYIADLFGGKAVRGLNFSA